MKTILRAGEHWHWAGPVSASAVVVDAAAYYAAFYRAASLAQRHIVLAGWQFDTNVKLLRGDAARGARYPVEFLPFLNALCAERRELRVHILAWDYSLIYSLEREWLQSLKFAFQSSAAVRFEFDAHPSFGGSHHQKLAVIDGVTAFAGGLDICEERWDDRSHAADQALRVNPAGAICRPNHEVQAAVQGEAATVLLRLFQHRWLTALGEELKLEPHRDSPAAGLSLPSIDPGSILPLSADTVAIARTLPAGAAPPVREVSAAIEAALLGAERLVYIETQYFTSRTVTATLIERLKNPELPKLQLLVLIPRGADTTKEKFALGDLQSAMLSDLEAAAEQHGHELKFLCSAVVGENCEAATFIHSKVLIVDDELLCVGSANMTERSMALDSELCLLWHAEPGSALAADIKRVRASLLGEHADQPVDEFLEVEGLVERVSKAVESGRSRLRECHFEPVSVNPFKQAIFDPDGPSLGGPVT
jgi:phosphatidylserine/phosphatidylglycerophosphate/cardiolipin synthase-like enzyme